MKNARLQLEVTEISTIVGRTIDELVQDLVQEIEELEEPIVVEVRGGVAYCKDNRVQIKDYDNDED